MRYSHQLSVLTQADEVPDDEDANTAKDDGTCDDDALHRLLVDEPAVRLAEQILLGRMEAVAASAALSSSAAFFSRFSASASWYSTLVR